MKKNTNEDEEYLKKWGKMYPATVNYDINYSTTTSSAPPSDLVLKKRKLRCKDCGKTIATFYGYSSNDQVGICSICYKLRKLKE